MAHEIESLQESSIDMADTIDEIGEDLSYLEEICCDLDFPEELGEGFYGRGYRPHAPAVTLEELEAADADGDDFDDIPDSDEDIAGEDALDNIRPLFPENALDGTDGDEGDELTYDGVIYDAICPFCGQEFSFDQNTLEEGSMRCPHCDEELEFDLDEDE